MTEDEVIAGSAKAPLAERVAAQLRLAPGGVQISPNEIAWDGGNVVLVFPLDGQTQAPPSSAKATNGEVTALAAGNCPTQTIGNDYYCFYEHSNWGGRRLQFKDSPQSVNFSTYGFDNQTSSWVNGGGAAIVVWDLSNSGGQQLWVEYNHTQSTLVAPGVNDRASSFVAVG